MLEAGLLQFGVVHVSLPMQMLDTSQSAVAPMKVIVLQQGVPVLYAPL